MEFKLKGADTYYNHGSTWIILTDKKQWVIELTKDGTLWYNYYFFQSILIGLMGFEDTVKNQNYITEWVENFIQNGVKHTRNGFESRPISVDDTIQNRVKETKQNPIEDSLAMEEVIQNGIKETKTCELHSALSAEHIIREGIKETWGYEKQPQMRVNEVINVGIKKTNWRKVDNHPTYLENILKK